MATPPFGNIIWHDSDSGETQIWFMDGHRIVSRATVVDETGQAIFIGAPFSIKGVGDLNGDGEPDIVWHHSDSGETQIWFMDGARIASRGAVVDENGQFIAIGPPFGIVGVGDFNRDGNADIVWYNSKTGETQLWFMNGHRLTGRATVVDEAGQFIPIAAPFSIKGSGDLNSDGVADIVWYQAESGETQIWFMEGGRIASRATVVDEAGQPIFIGPPFSIKAVGDLNGDGKGDLVWHHSDTGETQIWFMDGARIASRGTVVDENGQFIPIGPPFSIKGAGDRGRDLTQLIHVHYLAHGGRFGPFGYPVSDVRVDGQTAARDYRGGTIQVLDNGATKGLVTEQVRFTFLGFRCNGESDELSASDEPYFVIAVDQFNGDPDVRTFTFENIDAGDEIGVGALLVKDVSPNPTAIRVIAFEHDEGDPEETAAALQEKLVELSNEVASIAGAAGADAASGPGIGVGAAASSVGGVLGGPIGALIAAGIVSVLGLGDDFIGQDVTMQFNRPESTETPSPLGNFRGNPFNAKLAISKEDEGSYELFFDVHKTRTTIETD